jgi:hypothetical protein
MRLIAPGPRSNGMSSLTMLSAQLVPRGKKEVAFPMGAPYRHRTTVFWSRSLPAEQIIVPVHREETARAMPVFEILVVPNGGSSQLLPFASRGTCSERAFTSGSITRASHRTRQQY